MLPQEVYRIVIEPVAVCVYNKKYTGTRYKGSANLNHTINCWAVIVAAGNSTRMGGSGSKQFLTLDGIPAVVHTLRAFEQARTIHGVVIAARQQDIPQFQELAETFALKKVSAVVAGGNTRQESVSCGISALPEQSAWIAVHDGARALITPQEIDAVVQDAVSYGASTLAVPVKDTIKLADEEGFVAQTPERSKLWAVQTPQVFERELYKKALFFAQQEHTDYTDDCQLLEHAGTPVHLCKGSYTNMKLTTPEDVLVAEAILRNREVKY